MPHRLICGVTGSGKSTLAEYLAAQAPRHKIIFAPCGGFAGLQAASIYYDESEFLRHVWDAQNVDIYVDEADIIFSQAAAKSVNWIMQRGRHFGFAVTLITQRPVLLNTTARYQCAEAYVFRGNPRDYESIFPIYGIGDLKNIQIPPRQFIHLTTAAPSLELHELKLDASPRRPRRAAAAK